MLFEKNVTSRIARFEVIFAKRISSESELTDKKQYKAVKLRVRRYPMRVSVGYYFKCKFYIHFAWMNARGHVYMFLGVKKLARV